MAHSASASSSNAGSMFQVSRSQSIKVMSHPSNVAGDTLPIKVSVDARTRGLREVRGRRSEVELLLPVSDFRPLISNLATASRSARWVAAVPLFSATQYGMPVYSANSSSNASTIGPSGAT